ncbi:hypothetical protein VNO77_24642 [Canavalia gladiata]|uniref:Uncharacterized protein n=1 Tax=Canavalia gladiata TaxID=3824 RepID=A0AAN9LA09_CANGL
MIFSCSFVNSEIGWNHRSPHTRLNQLFRGPATITTTAFLHYPPWTIRHYHVAIDDELCCEGRNGEKSEE